MKAKGAGGWQRMRWLDSITDSMDMNLRKLQKTVEGRRAWHAEVHGVAKSQTQQHSHREKTGTLTHSWWECKMVQPLWKHPGSFSNG